MSVDFNELTTFYLRIGKHSKPEHGLCAMEAVAWLEGEEHSDHPQCVCPALGMYVRNLNDRMSATSRQRLIPYLPCLAGTRRGNPVREKRLAIIFDEIRRRCLLHEETIGYFVSFMYRKGRTDELFEVLDMLIDVAPPERGFTPDVSTRVEEYRKLMSKETTNV